MAIPRKDNTADAPSVFRLNVQTEPIPCRLSGGFLKMTEKEYPKETSFGHSRYGAEPPDGLCAVLPSVLHKARSLYA